VETAAPAWLVAGLGNPGSRYARTRHNIGWRVLDALASEPFRPEPRFEGDVSRSPDAWIIKPSTFMNLSGTAVHAIAAFYKIPHERVLVILDDAALPFGRLRIRPHGSAGSHNGLASVLVHFATQDIPRLRIGIGEPPPPITLHDHVLSPFTPAEEKALPDIIALSTDAIRQILKNGLAVAMNEFNKGGL